MKLTIKQKKFADEYIISGNGTQSYIKAGYKVKDDATARANSSRLLTNANVKMYIEKRVEEIKAENILNLQEALELTASIARGEPRKIIVLDDEGQPSERLIYPRFKDSNTSLEHFYRMSGEFKDKQEIEHTGSVQFLDDI